jgi:hypothetical protein
METAKTTPETVDPTNEMNLECNDEQWNFIFKYYPEYGSSPYQLITWLFGEAKKNEEFIAEQEGLYAKPG